MTTTTIFRPEIVTGSHILDIQGYSKTKGLIGVGNHVCSSAFTVGGHSWCVWYFPDGMNESSEDCISVRLRLIDPGDDSEVMAEYTFSLLDQDSEPWYSKKSSMVRFFDREWMWGFDCFIEREGLESSPHFQGDRLRIRCDITMVANKIIAETTTKPLLVVPPSDLHQHLGDLLRNAKVRGDVKFKVGGKKFRAHRNILAVRSSVFMAELYRKMKEKKAARIRIKDMEPTVFEAFLHFIYNDSLPEDDKGDSRMAMAQHLLVVADRYNMERLKLICQVILQDYIDTDNAATMMVLADQHGCHGLKQACLRFIASPRNMKVIMATEGFEYLTRSFPSLLKELADNIAV
ncbi:unnamed protein product [Urochloa decumbens]|uniref:Uncharacterized protein n=1 Tax=Urochloa decumbens TaxID=240449 RepID=A0ABC9ASB1_9POAL